MNRMLPVCLLLCIGCESSIRETSENVSNLQSQAVQVQISSDGMSSLYASSNPDGLPLVAAPSAFVVGPTTVQLGPLDDTLAIATRSFQPADSAAATLTRLASFQTFVPIRISDGFETRICKFEVDASEIDIVAAVGLENIDGSDVLSVLDVPTISAGSLNAEPFGNCDTEIDLLSLQDAVSNYVTSAIVESTGRTLEAPLVDALGLLDGSLEVQPPFGPSRNGEMLVTQQPNAAGVSIDNEGVSFSMDAQLRGDRASCVPPISPNEFGSVSASAVDTEDVTSRGADFGVSLSLDVINTVAQNAVLSGIACYDIDSPLDSLSPNNIGIEDIGLGGLPLESEVLPVFIPGALPTVITDADRNRLLVEFPDLTIELYGKVFGVTQRILALQTTVTFSLNIRPGPVGFRLNIESVDVDRAAIDSKWTRELPVDASVWIRRMLVVTLSNQLSFPLPLTPAFPLRLLEAEVRDNDVVLYLAVSE